MAAGGAGGAALGWRAGRGVLGSHRARVEEAVDFLLDELELGRQPGSKRALERLAERARKVRSGYRL